MNWMLPVLGIIGALIVTLIACSVLICDRVGSHALRLVITGSIAAALVALGFRTFMSRTKRQILSDYVFPEMSRLTLSIGQIFGLPALSVVERPWNNRVADTRGDVAHGSIKPSALSNRPPALGSLLPHESPVRGTGKA